MTKTFTDILGIKSEFVPKKFQATPLVTEKSTNGFVNAMSNKTYTENGALTNVSTQNALADWFYHGAALRRETNEKRILNLFVNAFNKDKTLALRTLFYIRDAREGQGERKVFRICLQYLGNTEVDWLKNNLSLIAEFGRYDDYLCLLRSNSKDIVVDFLGAQLEKDLKNHFDKNYKEISLLAKWMPSENTSSKETKNYAKLLLSTGKFGTPKAYRKALSILRKDLKIIETMLCKREYSNIDYSAVPSNAMSKYSKNYVKDGGSGAFLRNDNVRFNQFLEDVKKHKVVNGKVIKINANTLYPYDLVKSYMNGWNGVDTSRINEAAEEQWKALPDYVPEIQGIVVNDTSGSMCGLPLQVSMSLAVYIAERNKSEVWRNYVIPFSSTACWKEVKGKTLASKLQSIYTGDCSNTNLQSVFNLILTRAKTCKVVKEDMPKQLLIISDMQFDAGRFGMTNYEEIKKKYQEAGYDLPKLVWWNVESRSDQTPVTVDDKNNLLLSGCSPAVLKVALGGDYDVMEAILKVINQERYQVIVY